MRKTPKIISIILAILSVCILVLSCGCNNADSGEKEGEKEMILYSNPYSIYVSTTGNSSNDGTEANPLSDINLAINKAMELTASQVENFDAVRVYIKEGTYFLSDKIEINSSLPCGKKLVIEGENIDKVFVDGGKHISCEWTMFDEAKNIYKCNIGNVSAFRQLYVDGNLATRARYPENTNDLSYDYLPITWLDEKKKMGVPSYILDDIELDQLKGAELFFVQEWTQSIGHLPKDIAPLLVDELVEIQLENKVFNDFLFTRSAPSRQPEGRNKCWFENSLAFLTQEGEWYFDQDNNDLYYKPLSDQDINSIDVVVPQTENLITIVGNKDNFVKDVAIRGITFQNTNWNYASSDDYFDFQAGMFLVNTSGDTGKAPSCIYTRFVKDVVIDQVKVRNTGAYGIDINVGSKDVILSNSTIKNCSTSGINVGYFGEKVDYATPVADGYIPESEAEITERITIKNNTIENIGTSYKGGSTGIVAGYVRYFDILHNTIKNVSYSGIAVGWGWEWKSVINQDINICYNNITNTMNHLPFDGAPIYLLGKQVASLKGSTITNNYIEVENGLGGIYFDNSSSCYTLNDNVIKGTGILGLIDLHDWNYLLKNINIKNTYCSVGKIYVHAYWQNTAVKNWADLNKGKTPPTLDSRNVFYEEGIASYNEGKWSKPAQKIIDESGVLPLN